VGERGRRVLPADYVREHVELAYATTAHGAQGATASTAHLALGDHTSAASAYVGMTRGRDGNIVHVVAVDLDDAREQWVDAFARDRADLGPAHAAIRAGQQAAGYTTARPLDQVVDELRQAWREQGDLQRELHRATELRELITEVIELREQHARAREVLGRRDEQARTLAEQARAAADRSAAALDAQAQQIREQLMQRWNEQRDQARAAGQAALAGPGRLGHRILATHRATEALAHWSTSWQPYLPNMPTSTESIAHYAIYASGGRWIRDAFDRYARTQAEHAHPEHRDLLHTAEAAEQQWAESRRDGCGRRGYLDAQLGRYGELGYAHDLDQRFEQVDQRIGEQQTCLERVNRRLDELSHEPAVAARPPGWLEDEHKRWQADDAVETAALQRRSEFRSARVLDEAAHARLHSRTFEHHSSPRDMERHGPSLGH
jgi:exodeoxyribonuclease V alpha subunit